jgi:hypothetical protein
MQFSSSLCKPDNVVRFLQEVLRKALSHGCMFWWFSCKSWLPWF